MSVSTSATINNSLAWTQRDTGNNTNSFVDTTSLTNALSLTHGTGNDQINQVYYATGALGSGLSTTIDLYSLARDVLGNELTVSYENGVLKSLVVANNATGTGNTLYLENTGTNNLTGYSNDDGVTLVVSPKTAVSFNNSYAGYTVNPFNRYLILRDSGSSSEYSIAFAGIKN